MGKTSVIQAVFAMLQDGNNPFRGEYMNIGSVNELLNAIVRSSEIEFNMEYEYDGKIDRVEKHRNILNIDRKTFLQIRYEGSRIDCSLLETKYGSEYLEKNEFRELISTLDKFIQHNSWETIAVDDGLE